MNKDRDLYILLTDTGTVFAKMIRTFTKDPLNHASIAFDSQLQEVYSFGRKNPSNAFVAGFVKEDVRSTLFEESMCSIYKCTVNPFIYSCIRAQIQYFERNQDYYKYNLLGMVGVMLNIEWERKNAFFCSQFVATVFEQSGMHLVSKSPLLVTPGDLQQTTCLELFYQGKLQSYTGSCTEVPSTGTVQTA